MLEYPRDWRTVTSAQPGWILAVSSPGATLRISARPAAVTPVGRRA